VDFFIAASPGEGRKWAPLYLVKVSDTHCGTLYCTVDEAFSEEDLTLLNTASRLHHMRPIDKQDIPVRIYEQLLAVIADVTEEE